MEVETGVMHPEDGGRGHKPRFNSGACLWSFSLNSFHHPNTNATMSLFRGKRAIKSKLPDPCNLISYHFQSQAMVVPLAWKLECHSLSSQAGQIGLTLFYLFICFLKVAILMGVR